MRTKRINGSTAYEHIYNGGQLSQMTVGNDTLYFAYDANGIPASVTHNGTTYYYVTNMQGDVAAILDSSGTAVATYTYDAWGKPLSEEPVSGIGHLNPLRYCGYVFAPKTDTTIPRWADL